MGENNVAVYLDFENLAISARDDYPNEERPLKIRPIMDFILSKGNIWVKKAYADWSPTGKSGVSQYQRTLMEHGFELIHLPETTAQGKNGSDVRLAIDMFENMGLFDSINIFVLGSGDTDFVSLIQRVRSRGKKVIVIGFDRSVGAAIKNNCNEFKSLNELLGEPEYKEDEEEKESEDERREKEHPEDKGDTYGRDLLIRYLNNRGSDDSIHLSQLKMDILRLDPSFSEKKLGYSSFKKFVESLKGDIVENITNKNSVHFKDTEVTPKQKSIIEEAKRYLNSSQGLKYIFKQEKRLEIAKMILESYQKSEVMSLKQMSKNIFEHTKNIPKGGIGRYIRRLYRAGGALEEIEDVTTCPSNDKNLKLKNTINSPEKLEEIYINQIVKTLLNKYPDLTENEIKKEVLELKQ